MTDPAILSAYISGGFTLAAAVLAFGPVAFQIWRQGKLNREAAREEMQKSFKQDLYRDGVRAARQLSNAISGLHGFLRAAEVNIEVASLSASAGQQYPLPSSRYIDALKLNQQMADAILDVIFLIEERRVFDPRLLVFRDALGAAWHEFRAAFGPDLQHALMQALPTEAPNGELYPYNPPDQERLATIKRLINDACDPLSDISSYSEDLIVELQNVLLGETFGNVVEHRKPLDPKRRVIRLADYDELQAWLATTPWGLECASIDQRVKAQLAEKDAGPRTGQV